MKFFLSALTSSRQQILHHFKVPPHSNGNKSFAIASRFLKAMATNPLLFLQGFLKAIATNLVIPSRFPESNGQPWEPSERFLKVIFL
jgi:hypothetical protein